MSNPQNANQRKNTQVTINPTTLAQNYNVALAQYAATAAANKTINATATNKTVNATTTNKTVNATTTNKTSNATTSSKNGMDSTPNVKARTVAPISTIAATSSTQITTKTEVKTMTTTVTAASLAEKIKDDNLQRLTDTRSKVLKHYSSTLEDLKRNFQETITQLDSGL